MSQQLLMEADAEAFTINPEYEKFVPRPSYEQYRALEQDILLRGQLDPIKVNPKMVVLDGHTRYQILGDRGMRIKYIIISPEDEIAYMISLNIIRRNLNDFQKVETMYDHYKELKLRSREKNGKAVYDIIFAIKSGSKTTNEIQETTGYNLTYLRNILHEYTEDYTLSRTKDKPRDPYVYTVNPRGESILAKGQPSIIKGVEIMIGNMIGVTTTQLIYAIHLIEGADDDTLNKLRNGIITIGKGYRVFQGRSGHIKGYKTWGKNAKVECPNCNHVAPKKEYKLV